MPNVASIAAARQTACKVLLRKSHAIIDSEGATPAALERVKTLLITLASKHTSLFSVEDFAAPVAQGRNYLLVEDGEDGFGLYLTINLPGKVAAPHDHGIWCINVGISGVELQRFYRRTDDSSLPGQATVEETGGVTITSGTGMVMADHSIHATEVLGNQPAVGLALYGYAIVRFPSVAWYQPEFGTVRALPSRRELARA